jgi:hypothetical protein
MAKLQVGEVVDLIAFSKASAPLGDIKQSMLTLAQFAAENLGDWVLADGQSCLGSAYASVTGNLIVPDMRGAVSRMKSYGSGKNPDGDLALGAYQADQFASHSHTLNNTPNISFFGGSGGTGFTNGGTWSGPNAVPSIAANGGNETRMKNVTVNFFIKIGY